MNLTLTSIPRPFPLSQAVVPLCPDVDCDQFIENAFKTAGVEYNSNNVEKMSSSSTNSCCTANSKTLA